MSKKIFNLWSVMLLLLGLSLMLPRQAAAQNTLRVADFTAAAGKEAMVPIYLENSSDLVGMQFNITLPYAKSSSKVTLVDERIDGHSISTRKLSDTQYTVVVMSLQNRPLRGNGGLMVRFPVQVPADAQAGATKPVKLTDIVLTDKTGKNVATETTSDATFTVLRTPTPDFVVSSLNITNAEETLEPGGKLRLNFSVLNQGTGDSKDGWSEKIYLEDLTGIRTYVTTMKYGNTLPAGESMTRYYEVDIPQAMHMEGTVHAVMELVPLKSTDELIADQGNNVSYSAGTKELAKRLFLSKERIVVKEGGSKVSVTLTRSGDWTMAETFEIAEQNDHGEKMLTLPATVTIPAKKAGVSFYVAAVNDTEVNAQYRSGLIAKGDDYPDVTMVVDVEDDDSYPLTLTADKTAYGEGDEVTLTVGIAKALESGLKVDIVNTAASRFYPYVRSITIPAGQTSASAKTAIVNDDYPMADAMVTFTASATGYVTAKRTIAVQDDDCPALSMMLSNTIVSEGDGYGATMVTLTRKGNTAENVTLYLTYAAKSVPTGSNTKELFFDSQYVIIPAGQSSVSFPVSVEDNSQIEGVRIWTVTAAACDASTGKAVGAGHMSRCSVDLTVTDDDTEGALKLQAPTATLPEAGKTVTVTVSRNSVVGAQTITLTSEGAELTMPATVTIAAGQKTATFKVSAKADYSTEDNYYARVTATAADMQPAQFVFMVSTYPDAVCSLQELANAEPFGGQTIDVVLNVTNQGTSTLEPGMEVRFYLLNKKVYNPSNTDLTVSDLYQAKLTQAVPAGETVPMTFSIKLPVAGKEQQYYLMAWVNPRQNFAESNKGNGISANTVPIYMKPAYKLSSISTDKYNYTRGEVIHFTGKMSNAESGLPMEGQQVDVYMVNDTKRYQVTTTLDADGNFTAQYKFGEQTGGRYKIGACIHGAGRTDTDGIINVTRLQIERSSYLKQDITEGVPLEGDIQVTNLSEDPLYNVTFRMDGLPKEWTVELTSIAKLEGKATGNAHYRLVATEPDAAKKLISGTFVAGAKDSEGNSIADSEMPVYFWWYAAKAKLVAENIKTTLYRDGQRTLSLRVDNVGLKETGSIGVEWSSGQEWLSAPTTQLASIDKDGATALTLNLVGNKDMIVDGTYEAVVRLKPQNGDKLDVKVKCTVVSTDVANLTVDVVDAYTLGADDGNGPHVAGASVKLTNALTGEVAMTGTTDENGLFYTDGMLKEGTYYVYVTAPNHYYAEKTITVDPGVENQIEVFLNYEVVKISYEVERITVTDEYKTVLTMDIVPDIPQAIVVPTMPENWGTGQYAYSVRLTNKGRLTAYTPYLEFPNVDGVTFKVKSDYPAVIYPNESFDVTVEFTGPENVSVTSLGYIKMHYAFRLRGETYWGSETYAAAMGRGDLLILPGGGMPMAGSDKEGRNFGTYQPPTSFDSLGGLGFVDMPLGDIGVKEPEILIRDYTKSVDNRVRLQFEQKFLLEREAFRGTLKVENLQMNSIEDVTLVPSVKTMDGEDATDLFSISTTGVGSWSGKDRWDLASSGAGEAVVLYVPSKETAPTVPVDYLFGGTVTYRNVADGKLVVYELTPTKLAVNPSPDLHLTYFVQRDFLGDDPLTEAVEPWEPSQFALLIQNKGAGEALNLQIETSDPTIVDNACNLPVKFTKLYCTVDGKESNMNFNYLNLGSIAPGQNIMARWWYYCNVSAHVANYEVRMLKHSSFGEEFDLITLDGVRELTRSVTGSLVKKPASARSKAAALTDADKVSNIMLLNLIADEDNLPDHVMDLEGNETDDLEIVSDKATCTATAVDGQYTLTVDASREGWAYGVIHDPTNCTMQLVKAVRNSDGVDVTSNIWQTDRTVTSNYSSIVDNRLHWADNMGTKETYTLYYEPKPAAAPQVKSISLVTDETTDQTKATKAVVTFADAVDMTTLANDDVVVVAGDKEYAATVTPQGTNACVVDWGANMLKAGQYTLTFFTSGITNTEGTAGMGNKSLTWTSDGNYIPGDANGDGVVNIVDVTTTISQILGTKPEMFVGAAADVNEDNIVNIVDVTAIIDLVLKGK